MSWIQFSHAAKKVEMLDRITRVEFFAILPAGFYLFLVIVLLGQFVGASTPPQESLWEQLDAMSRRAASEPGLLVFVVFGTYLCGSVVRAFPVKWAERVLPPFRIQFPHGPLLVKLSDELRANVKSLGMREQNFPGVPSPLPMAVFNQWKNILCIHSADGFRYYQTFESRSRFFAGMFWAGIGGGLAGITMAARSAGPIAWQLLVPSIAIALLFGGQFRRVRRQEAWVLYSLHASLGESSIRS